MTVTDSEDIMLVDMVLQNSGTTGLTMDGHGNGVTRSVIRGTGDLGLQLRCGDRSTLEYGGCFLTDSEVSDFGRWNRTYAPPERLEGCGNSVAHNRLHSAPHAAILFTGNEHRIAFNEIRDVVSEANDAGSKSNSKRTEVVQ